jgi:hypothetical protein
VVIFIRFTTNKMFCIFNKYCCGGDDFLKKDAATEVSKLTLYINKITGYVRCNRAANDQFLRDQSYVVAVCCTPGVDAVTQTLSISGNSSVLKFTSKVVLLTQSTPAMAGVNLYTY